MFKEEVSSGVVYMTSDKIKTPHAFTTRFGGVSEGDLYSLNLGESRGDKRENVEENYRILKNALHLPDAVVWHKQVHGTTIHTVTKRDGLEPYDGKAKEGDGLITDTPDVSLFAFIADCVPILMYDEKRKAIGAIHAGWRGTVSDIAGKAVERMGESFGSDPRDIMAAIGPAIGVCCFETGPEVVKAVYEVLGDKAKDFIKPSVNAGKSMVDLHGINHELLVRAGVPAENIDVSAECTMCSNEKYWSHRFTGGRRGVQAAIITLRGE